MSGEIKSGVRVKDYFMKCPHMKRKCIWRLKNKERGGYNYLNNSCYLSGSSPLQCPPKQEGK